MLKLQHRNMATLKEISMRLKSVSNIAKITKSMKMIASTKMNRAQRLMESARVFSAASTSFDSAAQPALCPTSLVVAVSSDRGLCGGIHSSVSKAVKKHLRQNLKASVAVIGLKVLVVNLV